MTLYLVWPTFPMLFNVEREEGGKEIASFQNHVDQYGGADLRFYLALSYAVRTCGAEIK